MSTLAKPDRSRRYEHLNLFLARMTVAAAILLLALSGLVLIPAFADKTLPSLVGSGQTVTITSLTRVSVCVIGLAHAAVLAVGLFAVAALFRRFAAGATFAPDSGHLLRRFGLALLAFTLLGPVAKTATILAITALNPGGQHVLSVGVGISTQGIVFVLTAALLVALGHVMHEAALMADDHRQIV
jgi:hypothetical protein